MREPSDSADSAAEILDRLGLRWALIGALAAIRYRATPRMTTDADLLVERLDGVAERFAAAGYEVEVFADADEEPHLLTARGRGDRIDLLAALVEYQGIALDRAIDHVITVEDVIVHKLIAWRPRDRDDIASILEAGHDLDEAYIERWAGEWDALDRWQEARRSR